MYTTSPYSGDLGAFQWLYQAAAYRVVTAIDAVPETVALASGRLVLNSETRWAETSSVPTRTSVLTHVRHGVRAPAGGTARPFARRIARR